MIVFITNDLSEQYCDTSKLISNWDCTKLRLLLIPFTFTFLSEEYLLHYIHRINIKKSLAAFKQASKIIVHLQPTLDDLKDPYFEYLPLIYSFLHYHPCIKAKTFFIQPFYSPHSVEGRRIKQIYNDKIRLGDFQELPTDSHFTFPVTPEQINKIHEIIINLVDNDSACLH